MGTARLEAGKPAPTVVIKDAKGKDKKLTAKHVMLATGARAREIPQAGLESRWQTHLDIPRSYDA